MERKLPAFTVPARLKTLVGRLPQLPPTLGLIAALNLALDRVLPRDQLEPLLGKRLLVVVTDAGLRLRFALGPRGFRPVFDRQPEDLRISATLRDFIALALREEDPDTLFFSRRLLLEGDTELGLLVKNTLDAVDWDALGERLRPARVLEGLRLPGLRSQSGA